MSKSKSNTSVKKRIDCFKEWLKDFHRVNKPKSNFYE